MLHLQIADDLPEQGVAGPVDHVEGGNHILGQTRVAGDQTRHQIRVKTEARRDDQCSRNGFHGYNSNTPVESRQGFKDGRNRKVVAGGWVCNNGPEISFFGRRKGKLLPTVRRFSRPSGLPSRMCSRAFARIPGGGCACSRVRVRGWAFHVERACAGVRGAFLVSCVWAGCGVV